MAHSLFQQEFWDNTVRQHGARATQMAPLVVGTRRFADDPIDDGFQVLAAPGLDQITVEERLWVNFTAEQQLFMRTENARKAWAAQKFQAISDTAGPLPPEPEYEDDAGETEEEEKFECPRWDEFTQYLFADRAPPQLALDTMDFDIPEPTLYRYIIDRGGLLITPAEFRQFLFTANNRKQLFAYAPFPGIGTVTRIPTGWPSAVKYVLKRNAPPNPFYLQRFQHSLSDLEVQGRLYAEFQEFRDVDFEVLRGIVNAFVYPDDRIPADQIDLVVHECARESGGGGRLVTLDPRGIARLRFEVREKDRDQWLSKFARQKMVRNEEAVREAEEDERRRAEIEMERMMSELLGDDGDELRGNVTLEDFENLEDEMEVGL